MKMDDEFWVSSFELRIAVRHAVFTQYASRITLESPFQGGCCQ